MWDDPTLRMLFTIIVAVNFLIVGPMLVGIPVLAARRLSQGAEGYGIIMSTFGGSSLVGIVAGGLLPRPPARLMGSLLLGLCAVFSVGMALLGFSSTLFQMAAPVFAMGAASGYLVVFFFSWLQGRTPAAMMGRMMSLVLFASVGLVPVSEALSGVLMRASVTALFVGAGLVLAALLVRAALTPSLREMGVQMAGRHRGAMKASAVADRDQDHAGEHEARAEPLGPGERLVEDHVGGEHLGRDEGQADAGDVGEAQRPVAHEAGEGEVDAQAEESTDDLPRDEGAQPVGMARGREREGGADVEELVGDDDDHDDEELQRAQAGDGRLEGG